MKRATSVEDHKLAAAFESMREVLAAPKYADRKNKPLAFWALPGDRRLPMALLGRTIKDLLSHSLAELSATPGIGKKKLSSLIKLLHRATKDHPPGVPYFADEPIAKRKSGKSKVSRATTAHAKGFDPATVSELLWEQWRTTVRRYGLEHETLGRLAPSLERLPTVIWRTPLATYLDLTIADIRGLKTHGEKRLHAILEVFHSVHETLGQVPRHGHLKVDIRPNFTVPIERWMQDVLQRSLPPNPAELKQHVILPILEQLKIDAGTEIFRILEERLGIKGSPVPVQQQAKRLGVTRARVYQLLETCAEIMSVRWPEGEKLFRRLLQKLGSFPNSKAQLARLRALTDLIYPDLRDFATAAAPTRAGETPMRRGSNHQHSRNKNGALPRMVATR